jgi:hypothetical protein
MAKRKNTDQVQINVRMREGLRAKLEQSAKKNYESLNREIVDRLERSFDRQDLLVDALTLTYGEHVAGLLMAVGRAMEEAGKMGVFASNPWTPSRDNWADVPLAYREATIAATLVLRALRPPGEPTPPHPKAVKLFPRLVENMGADVSARLVDAIKGKAPPDLRSWASTVRGLLDRSEEKTS